MVAVNEVDARIVEQLRRSARAGASPSGMLKELARELGETAPHPVALIRYMRATFCLSLAQASPIAGWADGCNELSDAQIDQLLLPEIEHNRTEWDVANQSSAKSA